MELNTGTCRCGHIQVAIQFVSDTMKALLYGTLCARIDSILGVFE